MFNIPRLDDRREGLAVMMRLVKQKIKAPEACMQQYRPMHEERGHARFHATLCCQLGLGTL